MARAGLSAPATLAGVSLAILFCSPRIPGNTGATMRLAAVTGSQLHLAGPLGFVMDDAKLRRAGLDYRDTATTTVHASVDAALAALAGRRIIAFTADGDRPHSDLTYRDDDVLMFGPEPIDAAEVDLWDPRVDVRVRIPMLPDQRSLNLSAAASIGVYEAWRQLGYPGAA